MGVSFFETMSGHLVDGAGHRYAIDIEIKAEAKRLPRFLRDGTTQISGVVNAPPWAEARALSGTLEISPIAGRRIAYDFFFGGEDGKEFRFVGQKTLRWYRPVRSVTCLAGELRQRKDVVAHGELFFDLDELAPFLRSWWPSGGLGLDVRGRVAARGHSFSPALGASDLALLRTFAEALFVPGRHVGPVDQQTLDRICAYLHDLPAHVLRAYLLGLRWLDAESLLRKRCLFGQLPVDDRREMLELFADQRRGGPLRSHERTLCQWLSAPVKAVQFDHHRFLQSIGHPDLEREAVQPECPRYMDRVTEAESLDSITEIEAEVVVVGTGAGGGAVAKELAQKGMAVAIVEEGRYANRADFSGSPLERMRNLWRRGGMNFTVGRPPIALPLGRLVGGTTTINSGTCLRAPDQVLRSWWRERGFPESFLPKNFGTYYDRVARELHVGPNESRYLGRIAEAVARGADGMGLAHGPLPRNAPDCDAQGTCIFGCPTGAKRSVDVSYIPAALKAGAQLFVGLAARRILMRDGRAVGVEARGLDQNGAPRTLRIYAEHVVLACGSIHTPILLRENGFRLPQIGRNLSVHPGFGMLARFDQAMAPWNSIPQGYGVKGYEHEGICFEGFYLPPQIAATVIPFVGQRLTHWMDNFDKVAGFGFMVRDENVGSVHRDGTGRPLALYSVTDGTLARLQKGSAVLAELLIRGGAKEVLPGIGELEEIRDVASARAIEDAHLQPMDFNLLGAHPLATCRMGKDAESAVVDFENRVYGTENLYLADGSVVPTSLGVNPQMTIMAFATRLAEIIAAMQ